MLVSVGSSWQSDKSVFHVVSLSLIGILYVMWRNISKPAPGMSAESGSLVSSPPKPDQVSVDCSGANRGLFLGIFTLVAAIISTIVFFVLVERPEYVSAAVLVVHTSELVLYCLATIAVLAAAYRTRDLRFHSQRDNALDETLLLLALAGQFTFCVFGAVAGQYNTDSNGGTLVMATSLVIMLQATVQTVFILNGLRRSSRQPYNESCKPGREYITFLLVCNIAMWGMNTFESQRSEANPITLQFYGFLPWSIMIHISSPLAIFYRFHSTVCLANIWKNAYRQRVMWTRLLERKNDANTWSWPIVEKSYL